MNTTIDQVDRAALPHVGQPDSATGPRIELWRMHQVLELVPFSRTTLWRRIRARGLSFACTAWRPALACDRLVGH